LIRTHFCSARTVYTYGKYEIQGTALYNRLNPDCAGAELDISKAAKKYQPITLTKDPVLCGCFTEKTGSGKAYVFANMYEPDTEKEAVFLATFPGAKHITVLPYGREDRTQRQYARADARKP